MAVAYVSDTDILMRADTVRGRQATAHSTSAAGNHGILVRNMSWKWEEWREKCSVQELTPVGGNEWEFAARI
jgi:hypothetical protein